jgi:hypothetical protein
MKRLFRSKAVTGMGGAITAVAAITMVGTVATTTVGTAATTMAGGTIAIGDDFQLMSRKGAAVVGGFFSLNVVNQGRSQFGRYHG